MACLQLANNFKKYLYTTWHLFLFCLFPVRSWIDSHISPHTELPAEEGNAYCYWYSSCHFITSFCDGLFFLTNSSFCREIFVGACPWTIWRFACSNSPAGCMYIFCKYWWSYLTQCRLVYWSQLLFIPPVSYSITCPGQVMASCRQLSLSTSGWKSVCAKSKLQMGLLLSPVCWMAGDRLCSAWCWSVNVFSLCNSAGITLAY